MRNIRKMIRVILAFAVMCGLTAGAGNAASYKDTVKEIVICYLPNEGSEEFAEYRGLLREELGNYLGIKVTEINAADYNAVVEAMRTKHADIAAFGPVSYVQAAERAGAAAFAMAVPNGDKSLAGYTSKIIVKSGGAIKALKDLRYKNIKILPNKLVKSR